MRHAVRIARSPGMERRRIREGNSATLWREWRNSPRSRAPGPPGGAARNLLDDDLQALADTGNAPFKRDSRIVMEASQARTDLEGTTLGRYRLIVGLGHGGMAVVHLAVMHAQAGFNKLLVIKQIHERYTVDPEVLGMFLDEARLAARLNHPNVVQTNEVGQDGERHFLTMEYLDGQPLNRIVWRMSGRGGLPLNLHLRVLADVLAGLDYAHDLADYDGAPLGVVHRDVTPHNVFVTYDGAVKVVDFGIAKARDSATHTKVGIIKGKIAYMAPEQARGETVDRRADIFAVGVMLWEAITGARPWKGQSELTILKSLLAGQFPSARAQCPGIPAPLEAILLKAIACDRRVRYATAAELQADIEAYLETTGRPPEQRELGRLVSTHFQAERAKIKTVIEEQLRLLERAPQGAAIPLPIIEHPSTSASDPGDEELVVPWFPPTPVPRASSPGPTQLAINVPTTFIKRPHTRRALLVRAAALLAGAALFTTIGISLRKALPKVEAATPAASIATAATLAPATSTVELRLSASPPGARIFLDGVPLASNPWRGGVARDEAPHRIWIEAPGFLPWTESVILDKDRTVDVVLTGELAAAEAHSARAPDAPASPGPGPSHAYGKQRHVDAENPYHP
jgi:serine/threonine protein kinase